MQVVLDLHVVKVDHRLVLVGQHPVAFFPVGQLQVADPQAIAPCLVHVGGPDPLQGTADLGLALGGFRCRIEQPVRGQDQMGLARKQQAFADVDGEALQFFKLFAENDRVYDHAVAHHVDRFGMEDPRGDGVQHVLDPVEFEGMPGIGPALKAGDDIIIAGENVNDFSFSLVSPLEAEQQIYRHRSDWLSLKLLRYGCGYRKNKASDC